MLYSHLQFLTGYVFAMWFLCGRYVVIFIYSVVTMWLQDSLIALTSLIALMAVIAPIALWLI